jgi:hypothetical protein
MLSLGYRCEEGVEQSAHTLRFDPDPGILHRDEYLIVLVLTRSYLKIATAAGHGLRPGCRSSKDSIMTYCS